MIAKTTRYIFGMRNEEISRPIEVVDMTKARKYVADHIVELSRDGIIAVTNSGRVVARAGIGKLYSLKERLYSHPPTEPVWVTTPSDPQKGFTFDARSEILGCRIFGIETRRPEHGQ